ncbi:MAG: heparinase II/III family protein [Candidatus Latescibacterota bacterium]
MILMKRIILVLLFLAPATAPCAEITKDDIAAAMNKNILHHPYLYFSEEDKPTIFERIKTDSDIGAIMERSIAEANRLLYTPLDPPPQGRTMLPRYEQHQNFEEYLWKNVGLALNLAFVYQMTGDERYAQKAFEFADAACDMPTWVPEEHVFSTIYDRVWPWGAQDDQSVFSYCEVTHDSVFKMAAVYDWLYPALTKRQRDRIRGALLEKAILTVRGNYEYHWWATAYRCNWCALCNASLGVASIALLTENPELTDVIAESYNRVGKTLDEIKDGGWKEGMSYLEYGIAEPLRFFDALKRLTDGKYNLYSHPRVKDAVSTFLYCQFPPGNSVHFGDSASHRIGSYNMYNCIMHETGNREAAWLRKYAVDDRPSNLFDFFTPKSDLEPSLPKQASIFFPAVNWVILRSDFTDPEKFAIAANSGANDDPHHGHLDIGAFSLYWRGVEFISDHGTAGYDRAYFDRERWDYPLASSIGHNVVFVNGEKQLPCKEKDKPWNNSYAGNVIEFRPGKDRDYALLDPSGAYPKIELNGWRRHIILEKPRIMIVIDEVKSAVNAEIDVRFHSQAGIGSHSRTDDVVTQIPHDNYVMLDCAKGKMALIPVCDGKFTFKPGNHAVMLAVKKADFFRVPYTDISIIAKKDRTIIGAVILPVADDNEARRILSTVKRKTDADGNMILSFEKEKKKYSYTFKNTSGGLIFE